LALCKGVFLYGNQEGRVKRVKLNEEIIDNIKSEMRDYLTDMTHRYMSRRQILFAERPHVHRTDLRKVYPLDPKLATAPVPSALRRRCPSPVVDRSGVFAWKRNRLLCRNAVRMNAVREAAPS